MKKYIIPIIIVTIASVLFSISTYAVETSSQSSAPVDESSVVTESSLLEVSSQQSSEESNMESSYEEESSSESMIESSVEVSSESSLENSSEPSLLESSLQESSEPLQQESSVIEETSVEESSEQSYIANFTDPFNTLNEIDIILPINKPDYKPTTEDSTQTSQESSDESSNYAIADTSKMESNILDIPPIPEETAPVVQLYNSNMVEPDNTSFLLGIIFWSVIGLVITAVLIIVLHSNGRGGADSAFRHDRYHKDNPQKSNKKRLLSDKYYKK